MVDHGADRPGEQAGAPQSDSSISDGSRAPQDHVAEPQASSREERQRGDGQRPEGERAQAEGEDQDELSQLPGFESVQGFTRPYIAADQATGVRHEGIVLGGESYGFVQTLNRIVVPSAEGRIAVGTVERRLLEKVRSVLVPPPIADRAMRVLADQRVLVLQGRAHWGKASLALWLLSRVGRDDGGPWPEVYAIAPEVSLNGLPDGFFSDDDRPGRRYVIDTLAAESIGAVRLPVLRALCDRLRDDHGYLVVTVDSRTPIMRTELRDYLINCERLPAAEEVLRANLRWRLDGQEPAEQLLELPWVRRELRHGPVPGHLDQLAEVLASVARHLIDEADARAAYAHQARLRVEEWFESHPNPRERCLMVAAAVLNGASYHDVADAAERLRTLVEPPDEDKNGDALRPGGWGLASPRRQLVEDVGARIVAQRRSTAIGPSPSEVLRLENLDLQREVLEHLWEGHDEIRNMLLDWLEELGRHHDVDVSGRAAAAVGVLCRKDLPYVYSRLLVQWAMSPQVTARVSAAVALDVVAGDEELARQVRALLRRWIRQNPRSRLAWTATAAYGFHVGQRWPKRALQDLRLVIEEAPHHGWVASRSLTNLCQAGKALLVLDAISDWADVDDPPKAREPALRTFAYMLQTGIAADALAADAGADRDGVVPTLLRLAVDDEEHRARIVGLWKRAFEWVRTHEEAIEALGYWVALADERAEVARALDTVAFDLLSGTRQYQDELADVLREWADDPRWRSPTARRYLQSIGQEVAR